MHISFWRRRARPWARLCIGYVFMVDCTQQARAGVIHSGGTAPRTRGAGVTSPGDEPEAKRRREASSTRMRCGRSGQSSVPSLRAVPRRRAKALRSVNWIGSTQE